MISPKRISERRSTGSRTEPLPLRPAEEGVALDFAPA